MRETRTIHEAMEAAQATSRQAMAIFGETGAPGNAGVAIAASARAGAYQQVIDGKVRLPEQDMLNAAYRALSRIDPFSYAGDTLLDGDVVEEYTCEACGWVSYTPINTPMDREARHAHDPEMGCAWLEAMAWAEGNPE